MIERISTTVYLKWKVIERISTTVYLKWKVIERISTTVYLIWKVIERISTTVYLKWKVIERISTTVYLKWKVIERISECIKSSSRSVFNSTVCTCTRCLQYKQHLLHTGAACSPAVFGEIHYNWWFPWLRNRKQRKKNDHLLMVTIICNIRK